MKKIKFIAALAVVIGLAGSSGYSLAQPMPGRPMMQPPVQQKSPAAESGESSQRESATGSEMGPPYGPGGGYGPGYGMGPWMMGPGWSGAYGMGPGMMGPGMMGSGWGMMGGGMLGPGMMGPGMGMGGGFGPGMGMMGPDDAFDNGIAANDGTHDVHAWGHDGPDGSNDTALRRRAESRSAAEDADRDVAGNG